ncbi:hypothetical protein Q9233_004748, partial [Columba guinea]
MSQIVCTEIEKSGTDVESFVSQTSVKIFDVPVEKHILLFTPTNSEAFNGLHENYKSAAAELKGSRVSVSAQLHLPSEEILEVWNKMLVKVLVGKNFNRIVFNKTMTVFVMF